MLQRTDFHITLSIRKRLSAFVENFRMIMVSPLDFADFPVKKKAGRFHSRFGFHISTGNILFR
jgi:hypothetical protein